MSKLILDWLNQEVQLSKKVGAFERDFANGYLFGELLYKHGLYSNFEDDFVDQSSMAAKRTNFDLIKKSVSGGQASNLGIKITDAQVDEIMDEDRGSSLKLLYQLRRVLKKKDGTALSGPQEAGPYRLDRKLHGEHEEQFFDQKIRGLRPIDHRYPYEVHTKHFVDEHTQQLNVARQKESKAAEDLKDRVQDFRQERHEKMRVSRAAKEHEKVKGEIHWQGVQERKIKMMEKDLVFEKEMIRRDRQRIVDIRNHYQNDCGLSDGNEAEGIGWFERNLQRIGIDTSEHAGTNAPAIEAKSLKELHEQMIERMPTKAQLQIESQKRMAKIRETKQNTDIARKERERRQHRVQVEQQATTASVEEKKREDDLLAWLLEDTAQYRQEASEYELMLRRKEAQWQQREAKQLAYAEKAAIAQEEAWERLKERSRADRTLRLSEKEKMGGATDQFKEEESSDEDDDLDPMGFKTTAALDSTSRRSHPGTASTGVLGQEAAMEAVDAAVEVASAEEMLACVREPAVAEYLFARGAWGHFRPSEDSALETLKRALDKLQEPSEAIAAPRLGSVVQWLCKAPQKPLTQARLPEDFLPIIAISGNPAGLGPGRGSSSSLGSSLADRLCQEFGYAVIRPQEVVEECVALSRKPPQEPDWPILARMRELGKEVDSSRQPGLPPSVYAEMCFRKIELLSSPAPKPVEEEDPKAKKGKGKDKTETAEAVRPKGIIILGYLSEMQQHASWEAALRCFSSPLLQLLDSEEDKKARMGTVLAPFWIEDGEARPVAEAREADGAAEEAAEPVAEAAAVPAQLIRLQHPDEETLRQAILQQATEEGAWDLPVPAASLEEGATPAPYCEGFEQDLALSSCPVDRAWLYEAAQVFVRPFAEPLHCTTEMKVQEVADGEESIDAVEACFRQARDLIASWQRPVPSEEQAEAQEAQAEDAAKEEDAQAQEQGEAEIEKAEDTVLLPDMEDEPQGRKMADKEEMRSSWLQSLSSYLLGLRSIMIEVDNEAANYAIELVNVQRRFLDFLQQPDEKAQVMEEFLRSFPLKHNAPVSSAQNDEMEEQLQDLTDRLWAHANQRRQETVEERERLLKGGFWEDRVATNLRLAHKLQVMELSRFQTAARILREAYTQVAEDKFDSASVAEPERLSELEDIAQWLDGSAERMASAAPSGIPDINDKRLASGLSPVEEELAEDSHQLAEPLQMQHWDELGPAICAERLGLARRTRAVAAWTYSRLAEMRKQYDEAFARMDEWIRFRVKEENDAIKATATLLRKPSWEDEDMATMSGTDSLIRKSSKKAVAKMSSGAAKRRLESLKAIVPHTLDVAIYTPPKLEVCSAGALQGSISAATSRQGSNPPGTAGTVGTQASATKRIEVIERWSQDMLWGLLLRFLDLGAGSTGVVSPQQLQQVLLERRHAALGYEQEKVAPLSWVQRPEDVYGLLCRSMLEPAWGATAVDVTEFMLALIHTEYQLAWPSLEALEQARGFIESEESRLTADTLAEYPDVPLSEELFMKLPLWSDEPACTDDLKQWIFQVLQCFEKEADPSPPPRPPSRRMSGDGGAMPRSSGTLTARRLFVYLGLGRAPADGFQRMTRLLLPSAAFDGTEETPAEVRVQDLWTILFSCKGRPTSMVAPAPDLATFCAALLQEAKGEPSAAAAKGKAAPKAKGKAAPVEEDTDAAPPPPPEEVRVAWSSEAVLKRPSVLGALCSHGALLCRRRGVETLFPQGGGSGKPLMTASEVAAAVELQSLVPPPSVEVESAEE
mmetsp:Transcript_59228/g.105229  ORF Transcript_59228/g.105229 Transcript_59228/m.105229 type:complete len:1758 (+) Transcript_59228:63-5336(+)